MKIAGKIRLSHFALALLVLVVGALGYFSVRQISAQYEQALRQTMPVIDAIQDARFFAERVMAIAFQRQPDAQREAGDAAPDDAADLAKAFAALRQEIRRHRELVDTYFPDERAVVEALDRESLLLRDAATRLLAAPLGSAASDAARGEIQRAVDAIAEVTTEALAEEQQELAEYQATVDALRATLLGIVAACSLAAFVIAVAVGVFVARRLARPIVALRDTAQRFAQRDLNVRATPHGSDEVGELAGAFNTMAATLGETMVSRDYVENILARVSDGVLVLDENGCILRANPAATAILGAAEAELRGCAARVQLAAASPGDDAIPWPTPDNPVEIVLHRAAGKPIHLQLSLTPLIDNDRLNGAILTLHDTSQLKRAESEMQQRLRELEAMNQRLKAAQDQLLQSEKMAAIGQLAAGVAHEINNPIGFVSANLGTLARDLDALIAVLKAYEDLETQVDAGNARLAAVRALKRDNELDYLLDDLPKLIAECRDGTNRVRVIVLDLKTFSHADEGEWQWANLEQCLDSTLNIVWHELKYKVEIVKDYRGIPEVFCLPAQLNQVFMNLLVNAGQAIVERGIITLRTGTAGGEAWVSVEDTGCGIPPENLKRIFDPFFTTKPVGQGTGLGLSLAYGIIGRHHGRIEASSEAGRGTVFRIMLPIAGNAPAAEREAEPVGDPAD